jgi:hypothetical protein
MNSENFNNEFKEIYHKTKFNNDSHGNFVNDDGFIKRRDKEKIKTRKKNSKSCECVIF